MLTDTKLRNMPPGSKPVAHGGVTGLVFHPSATQKGSGKWVLRFVSPVTGKRRNAGLGSYPEIGLAEAVRKATAMRHELAQGKDPLAQRTLEEDSIVDRVPTFEESARKLHAELLPSWKNYKHGQQWINTLESYVFPFIGSVPVDQIKPRDAADVLRPIWLDKQETASRVKQRMHAVMDWAWAHEHCSANPMNVVTKLLPPQTGKAIRTEHQPAMAWKEIPGFVHQHLLSRSEHEVSRAVLELVIHTAVRSGEARGMRWDEINRYAGVWTISAERMKMKLPHRVPLSSRVLEIIERQRGNDSEWVFPSSVKRVPLSDMALTELLRGVQAPSTTPGRVATAHGFRSSFRDWCSENGYAKDLAERALAHTISNQSEAAYHRTDLLEQRRDMMEAWSIFVMSNSTLL